MFGGVFEEGALCTNGGTGREGVFDEADGETGDFETKKMSVFGEAKVDGARW